MPGWRKRGIVNKIKRAKFSSFFSYPQRGLAVRILFGYNMDTNRKRTAKAS